MDNLTHSLAGLAVGELTFQTLAKPNRPAFFGRPREAVRGLYWTVSLAANNFPDLDFLYSWITQGKVGYLLHHRGHTHTAAAALPAAAIIMAAFFLFTRWMKSPPRGREWRPLVALALAGTWLHVAMDGMNNYGVHPFWPLDNRWYYGDFVFILEPWFWMALTPPLLFSARSRTARVTLGLIFFGGIVAVWVFPLVPRYAAAGVTIFGLVIWFLTGQLNPLGRAAAGVAAALAVAAALFGLSHYVRETVEANAGRESTATVRDVVLMPLPANPLCWITLRVSTEGDTYRARRGIVAVAPRFFPSDRCPEFRASRGTAPLEPVPGSGPRVRWVGEYQGSLSRLRELAGSHCQVAAMLRFTRVPFLVESDGDELLLGDLRYDFGNGPSFAVERFPRVASECPRFVPPWLPPATWLFAPVK